jgi:hypothetical protein
MAIKVTFKCSQVTWHGYNWSATTTGGPIEVSYSHSGRVEENRVGDNEYPSVVATPDKSCIATVTLREVKMANALTDFTGPLVLIIAGKGAVTSTITLNNMCLVDVSASQRRGEFGASVLRFAYEDSTGTTNPVG